MFHQLIVFACATLVLGAPRNSELWHPDVGIIGGHDANIENYPYQVSIWFNGNFICSGSILDEKHILTTVSCTSGTSAQQLQIHAGTSFLSKNGTVVNVKAFYQHGQYDSATSKFDVSVILLESPLNFSKTIAPVGLGEDELPEGLIVNVTGWGSTNEDIRKATDHLQVVQLPIVSRTKCRTTYGAGITEIMICAGFMGGKGFCYGDVGAPLVFNNKQYGIASFSQGCAEHGFPGVYTNTVALRDFITYNMRVHQ